MMELHVQYCFVGCMGDTTTRCIAVVKNYDSKSKMSSVVPLTGASHEYRRAGSRCSSSLVLRSDQEPALQDLFAELDWKGKNPLPRLSMSCRPLGLRHQTAWQRGVQTVEGQIRVYPSKVLVSARPGVASPATVALLSSDETSVPVSLFISLLLPWRGLARRRLCSTHHV